MVLPSYLSYRHIMDAKQLVLLICLLAMILADPVAADFFYNPPPVSIDDLQELGLKCVPRRTVIKISEKDESVEEEEMSSSEENSLRFAPTRKKHMTFPTKDEYCRICVCSSDGKDEYCSKRPAMNVNECMMIQEVMGKFTKSLPFEHEKNLSFRIRRVGNGVDKRKCVPFVSQYTDCTDENICSGCTKCVCTAEAQWSCDSVQECDEEDQDDMDINDDMLEQALKTVEKEIRNKRIKEARATNSPMVPTPKKSVAKDLLLDKFNIDEPMDSLFDMMRQTRSIKKESKPDKTNNTIKFFGVIDELNEDTLTNSNISGTLPAQKVDSINLPITSRRSGSSENTNTSLQIEFSEPSLFNHITDNKIDTTGHNDVTFNIHKEKVNGLVGNHTQETRDQELSKLVVNELKKGTEVIGDSVAPVISNITFTPENETFSAMAFIAGNLLNKLWNIEKDTSGTGIETEMIKHERIANLLELFKEPLTLKQEIFLKTALTQLSAAIDKTKDIKNISICENIEEAKKMYEDVGGSSEATFTDEKKKGCKKRGKNVDDNEMMPTDDAFEKIHKVMQLIHKFDGIEKKIKSLKNNNKNSDSNKNEREFPVFKKYADDVLTTDEKSSLRQFQYLLRKITGMLYPRTAHNKFKNQNISGTNEDVRNKLQNMYDIDLNNLTVTAKDTLIFDYLSHIESNPDCLFKENSKKMKIKNLANIEGSILLNLSEFFKIKSFSDLVKLLESKKELTVNEPIVTTQKPEYTTFIEKKISRIADDRGSTKLETTKDKFKIHLKTILEDLIEIQNAKGLNSNSEIKLADALPCLYNLLNADKELFGNKTKKVDSIEKVVSIFHNLRNDLKAVQTRRSGIVKGLRPQSAIVWERTIKDLNKHSKAKTRRIFNSKPVKTFDEIKKSIEKLESGGSNTYKSYAMLIEVPAADKLTLLKTLEADIRAYIRILEDIKMMVDDSNKLTSDKQMELMEFLGNVATNINLNDKVYNNVNKPKPKRYFVAEMNSTRDAMKTKIKTKQTLRIGDITKSKDDVRVSRDLIINQLIKNRILLYIKLKEAKGIDLDSDINYKIAQKILIFLESGNYKLAMELYKVFVAQSQENMKENPNNRQSDSAIQKLKYNLAQNSIQEKQPLIQFEQPRPQETQIKWMNQDFLIKQLLNIKSLTG